MVEQSAQPAFPNYVQMRQPLPVNAWWIPRILGLLIAAGVIALLFARPEQGLTLWWDVCVPLLPLWFFLAPGLWRNVCPMASLNQTPRVRGFTRGFTPPRWLRFYGFVIGYSLFLAIAASRKLLFNTNGSATAVLLLVALSAAFAGGYLLKGKSGWCSSICPLLPVQRVYGQTPFLTLPNAHCQPCVGCAKNCYDFNPRVAFLADTYDEDQRFSAFRRLFVGAFPGFIVAFYTLPNPPAIPGWELYARVLLYALAGAGSFLLLNSIGAISVAKLSAVYGVVALNLYYWYTGPLVLKAWRNVWGWQVPSAAYWALRALVLALSLIWLWRTFRKERVFLQESGISLTAVSVPSGAAAAIGRQEAGKAEVTFMPEERRVGVKPGRNLLEIAEESGCKIEAGCRMGMCGADPVAIVGGMENLSPVRADESATLERLGLADNTRLACCARVQGPVAVSLTPGKSSDGASKSMVMFSFDPGVQRLVVIGNGIAGITAADHARRRHPKAEITVIGREPFNLYNRMAIERLIYGRSAMQGLYLLPEEWYEEHAVTCLLNTRVHAIDRSAKEVVLATDERLPYDRLILAMGSKSMVPPVAGFSLPGSFVLREAGDAIEIRAYAQERGCRRAVVAGGGLLGLEAAHALHRLGLRATVLERSGALLRRQLDPRGSIFLQEYLEGLGMEIVLDADTAAVEGDGRVERVRLRDGRVLPCDLFLVAAGIVPNAELAAEAGLAVNRGVIVDEYLRTSDPDILAAGDVAEFQDQVVGLWPVACDQAQVAAVNAVGGRRVYEPTAPVTMLKVVGVDLLSIGRFSRELPGDIAVAEIEGDAGNHRYRRLLIAGGKIEGAVLIGYPLDAPIVTAAVRQHTDVSGCLEDLKAGRWEVLAPLV